MVRIGDGAVLAADSTCEDADTGVDGVDGVAGVEEDVDDEVEAVEGEGVLTCGLAGPFSASCRDGPVATDTSVGTVLGVADDAVRDSSAAAVVATVGGLV